MQHQDSEMTPEANAVFAVWACLTINVDDVPHIWLQRTALLIQIPNDHERRNR